VNGAGRPKNSRRENRRASDARPVEVGLEAHHDMGELQLRASRPPDGSATKIYGIVIETVRDDVKGILLAPSAAAVDAAI
jgi:hypothetical protein